MYVSHANQRSDHRCGGGVAFGLLVGIASYTCIARQYSIRKQAPMDATVSRSQLLHATHRSYTWDTKERVPSVAASTICLNFIINRRLGLMSTKLPAKSIVTTTSTHYPGQLLSPQHKFIAKHFATLTAEPSYRFGNSNKLAASSSCFTARLVNNASSDNAVVMIAYGYRQQRED